MASPTISKIVNAQKKLIEDKIRELSLDEAHHSCWACFKGLDNKKFKPKRAHIISNYNGGNNKPNNYFLLCKKCHSEQPDGNSFDIQLKWLLNHQLYINELISFPKEILDLLNEESEQYNNQEAIVEKYCIYLTEEIIRSIIKESISKSSGPTNSRSNIKYWFLDHFNTWLKLKKLEGNFQ
ncbi:MAG: HNH endonuclease [Balneolaceae bacterium]